MVFNFNFYSALLLFFFGHGCVYGVLLATKSRQVGAVAPAWLAGFIGLCVLYIGPWMLGFAGWYDQQPYRNWLFYLPLQHLYLLGPVMYFYVQAQLNPQFEFKRHYWWHFLPGLLYLLGSGSVFVVDQLWLGRYFFLQRETDPDFADWYQLSGFLAMVGYAVLGLRFHSAYQRLIEQALSDADRVTFRWIRRFLSAFLAMLLLRLTFWVVGWWWTEIDNYVGNWWFYFVFSGIFYYVAIAGYANSAAAKLSFRATGDWTQPVLLLAAPATSSATEDWVDWIDLSEAPPQLTQPVLPADLQLAQTRLLEHLANAQPYTDPELSLTQLAKQLELHPAFLSRLVNQAFGKNFNDFINGYRVEAFIEQLRAGRHHHFTLLALAFESGFNSKATFNRAFRKHQGMSPQAFLRQLDG